MQKLFVGGGGFEGVTTPAPPRKILIIHLVVVFVVSYKIVVKHGWLERARARNRTVKLVSSTSNFQSPILKLVATFLVWTKTRSFNVSHFSRFFNLFRH